MSLSLPVQSNSAPADVVNRAALRIDRARWWSLSNHPFYGSLAMKLPDVFNTPGVDTAATDGRSIHWNAVYVGTLTDEQLRFILLHETLHCAHQHMWRLPADERGNAAADHAINHTLKQVSGISMPEGGLCDPQYAGMAEEDILRAMPEPDDEDGDGSGGGTGAGKPDPCGSFTAPGTGGDGDGDGDGQGDSGQSKESQAAASQELRESWETAVIQAAQAAQASGQGHIPADMARVLEKLRTRAVDWRRELADFVHSAVASRNDWSRAARRHAWQPVIYPRKRADELGTVIFARDTSGSVDDATLSTYTALIESCLSETGCDGIILDCDAEIKAEYEVGPFDPVPLRAKGGGGTDFRPVFNRADEIVAGGGTVAGVVYMTDLAGRFPDMPSELATLWLAVPNRYSNADTVAPFGRTVKVAQ